jgi:hypothetical protein
MKKNHGLIKKVKSQLKKLIEKFDNTTEFLQAIKERASELFLFGAPFDAKDLTKKILDRHRDKYNKLACDVQARDVTIIFKELYEKLLNFKASLPITKLEPSHFLATTNSTS